MTFPLIPATLTAAFAPAAIELGKQVVEQLDFADLFAQGNSSAADSVPPSASAFQPINGLVGSTKEQIDQVRSLLKKIEERLGELIGPHQSDTLTIRDNGFGDLQVTGPTQLRATLERQLNQDSELKQAFQDLYRYAVQAEPEVISQAGLQLQNPDRFHEVRIGNRPTEAIDFSLSFERGQLSAAHD